MLFSVIVNLLVWAVVLGIVWWLVNMLPLPDPMATIVRVLFICLAILIVLSVFGLVNTGLPKIV
jgi:hypothetical protein